MESAMVGLGRMGANMARRLCGVATASSSRTAEREGAGAGQRGRRGVRELEDVAQKRCTPRPLVHAAGRGGRPTDGSDVVVPLLAAGDVVIDGGNSRFQEDQRGAAPRSSTGMHFLDAGTSGGIWGLEGGYCLMVGGAERRRAPRADLRARCAARAATLHAATTAPATSSRWSTTASSTG